MTVRRVVSASLVALSLQASAGVVPLELKADGKSDPLSTTPTPRLSWRIESEERGAKQSAWQILAASSPGLLKEGKGDLWDSGKVATERSPFVRYAGKDPGQGKACYWKVRSWVGGKEPSEWSQPAIWERSPFTPEEWRGAKWIDDGKNNPEKEEDLYRNDPAPLLRKEFTLGKPVVRARLHIAGLGIGIPSLNGERIGNEPLGPPWTNFEKRIHFGSFDVTAQISEGENCLGLTLGNGWFNPLPLRFWGHRNIRGSLPVGRPRAIACLVIDHPDGSTTTIATGEGWKAGTGATLFDNLYLGEVRDARLAIPGWDKAGFDDAAWKAARVTEDSLAPLQPMETPPVRAHAPIPAVAVTSPSPGVYIVDFGTNFTGVPEIEMDAPAGTKISFRYGELLNADGTLNPMTSVAGQIKGMKKDKEGNEVPVGGPGAPEVAWQKDEYIAAGGGKESYRPDFTFHAFRFMEVTGMPVAPAVDACKGIPLHSDLPEAGEFTTSNELFNRIDKVCHRTFLSNVVSVQSDCPHRERFGYGGDIAVTSETYLMNFDMAGFYSKTIRDWADAAKPDGRLTDTAPFVGIDYCGVGWAMAHPLLLEQLYIHYGDRSLLDEQVPVALRWLDGEAAKRKEGLVTYGLGDHEALTNSKGPQMNTPMFVDAARRVGRLAQIIGDKDAAVRCMAMADESAAAWAKAFLDPATGKVEEGTQTAQSLALGFGAAPEEARTKVFDRLVDAVNGAENGPALTTGIFGTRFVMEELSNGGRSDLAYELANRKTMPSWGWMLENDATTLWEHWAGSDNTFSHNHPMFGSVSGWFRRWLGGIQAADDAVGFDRIVIRPQVVGGLTEVKSSHRTIRGLVESNWTNLPRARTFEIVIPPDTEAVVELPVRKGEVLAEGGKQIVPGNGIEVLENGESTQRLKLGSGRYIFTTPSLAD
jgi:alpha-L-rhamnosidase